MLLKTLRRRMVQFGTHSCARGGRREAAALRMPDRRAGLVLLSLGSLLALLSAGAVSPALGQLQTGQSCVPIEEPLERLACYDAIFDPSSLRETSEPRTWVVRTENSLIDGRLNVYLELPTEQVVPVDYGVPQRGKLQIRCIENVTSLRFWVGGNYMSEHGEFGVMTYRVDNRGAQQLRGQVTNDNQYIGTAEGSPSIALAQQFFDANSLLLSLNPVNRNEAPVALTFRVEGLAKAIEPLRQSCSW
jgi:type VI secretion system protein VasI